MGALLKKITTLVKDGFTGTVPLSLEDTDQEKRIKNESDAHKAVSARKKILLHNSNYGSRRQDEK